MSEAVFTRDRGLAKLLAAATIDGRSVIQLPTGEAAFLDYGTPISSGAYTDLLRTDGKATVNKTSGIYLAPGQRVWWDHSANTMTYKPVNDRDFYLGIMAEEAASAAISGVVDLNKQPSLALDMARDFFLTAITGTQGLNTMGLWRRGGGAKFIMSATSEVQKVDALSVRGFDKAINPFVEVVLRVVNGGAASAADFNIGVANGTHATDADSISEHLFLHIDGNNTNLNLQSKDGTTTVASTDTTTDYTAGSTVAVQEHWLFDLRDLTDIQVYRNGVNMLPSSTFRLDNAASTLFLLAHMEKTSSTDQMEIDIESFCMWSSEQ